jgi:hypothetical protein
MLLSFFTTDTSQVTGPYLHTLKKDEMNQDIYDDLIARIRIHCQETAQDARPGSGWARRTKDYVSWYVPERKTSLVLKPEGDGQEPTLAFPKASEQQMRDTEQQLGFPLPRLLRHLYAQIANGGFGPGFGIIGVENGYLGVDHSLGSIAHRYQWEIDFADACIQHARGGWRSMTPRQRQAFWDDGIGSKELFEAGELAGMEIQPEREVTWYSPWPERLLPLCEHGCNITTYLFADSEQVVQGMHGPDLVVAASLEEWLERWLAGEELQLM